MSVSVYKIKRWLLMLSGKSISHVNQGVGKHYSVEKVEGYYNDLTEKVTKQPEVLEHKQLPLVELENGDKIEFPTAIFQYGLGAYDLYLDTNNEEYRCQFKLALEWACSHQEANGAWNNFYYIYPDNPYCAMAQGEGVSLLVRGYIEYENEKYLECAKKAACFMLIDVKDGGTTTYEGDDLILLEYTHKPPVLNGWIFALWGLFDLQKIDNDVVYRDAYQRTVNSLKKYLPLFSKNYWSKYNLGGLIASPFYHNLHIAQMVAMYELTKDPVFQTYASKWEINSKNPLFRVVAFVEKAIQKIME